MSVAYFLQDVSFAFFITEDSAILSVHSVNTVGMFHASVTSYNPAIWRTASDKKKNSK